MSWREIVGEFRRPPPLYENAGVMKRKRRISQDLNLMFHIIKIMFDELQNNL